MLVVVPLSLKSFIILLIHIPSIPHMILSILKFIQVPGHGFLDNIHGRTLNFSSFRLRSTVPSTLWVIFHLLYKLMSVLSISLTLLKLTIAILILMRGVLFLALMIKSLVLLLPSSWLIVLQFIWTIRSSNMLVVLVAKFSFISSLCYQCHASEWTCCLHFW